VYAEEGYEASVSNLANVSLDTDGIFSDDSAGTQLATMTGDVASGYHASLSVGVDTTTAAGGGSGGGGMPGGAPPSGGTGDTTATTTA
jgi:hypothetical protein